MMSESNADKMMNPRPEHERGLYPSIEGLKRENKVGRLRINLW